MNTDKHGLRTGLLAYWIGGLMCLGGFLSCFQRASAQALPPDDFFHGGAMAYLSNNIPTALERVTNGLALYPNDEKLKKLEALLKQQQEQNQQQQNQDQQDQQQKNDQSKQDRKNQNQDQQQSKDQKKSDRDKQNEQQKKEQEKKDPQKAD